MPRLSRRAILALSFVIGLALWLIPAGFLHQSEPWDGNGPAYPLALLGSGLLLGFLAPGRPGTIVAGMFLGQLAVLLWRVISSPENSELWLVGVVMLAGYTFVASGLGALIGGVLRRRMHPDLPVERRVSDRRV
ncbi:MAG TPA: hypothetical protein VJU17_03945 [Gemmatimonadales bacterium]|nr:hypothetical protein [Gemmatimonadales bacterium]